MDAEKMAQVVEAVAALHADQPEGEKKKPTVADVEDVVGFDVSGAERDEAWDEYQAQDGPDEEQAPAATDTGEGAEVTNRYGSPLSLSGVTIPPGETRTVPGFNPENGVIQAWIEAGVIEVG